MIITKTYKVDCISRDIFDTMLSDFEYVDIDYTVEEDDTSIIWRPVRVTKHGLHLNIWQDTFIIAWQV